MSPGRVVHKQIFRRLIEQQERVAETGATMPDTGGRPAKPVPLSSRRPG
jgi:hypothetical protein